MGTRTPKRTEWPLLAAGAVVSCLGLAILLGRVEHRSVHIGQLWPLFLIAAAAGVTGGRRNRSELRKGLILLAVGLWLLSNTLALGGLDYGESWPLLLILIGVAITVTPESGRWAGSSAQGPVLILWGSLAWIATHEVWGLTWGTVWPLALVAIGIAMVWQAIAEQFGSGEVADGEIHNDERNA